MRKFRRKTKNIQTDQIPDSEIEVGNVTEHEQTEGENPEETEQDDDDEDIALIQDVPTIVLKDTRNTEDFKRVHSDLPSTTAEENKEEDTEVPISMEEELRRLQQ